MAQLSLPDEEFLERLELLQKIHVAEKQMADGKGVEHEEALRQILQSPSRA